MIILVTFSSNGNINVHSFRGLRNNENHNPTNEKDDIIYSETKKAHRAHQSEAQPKANRKV
jgi:hypothetical protein